MGRSKKIPVGSILCFLFCIASAVLTVIGAMSLDRYALTYEDTIPKAYTFQEYKIYTGKSARCLIYVEEEEEPLIIHSIFLSSVSRSALDQLSEGDPLTCYVTETKAKDCSYEIVEITSPKGDLLTLEDHNAEHRDNQTVGCWCGGFFSLLSLFLAVTALIHFYKPNNFTGALFR